MLWRELRGEGEAVEIPAGEALAKVTWCNSPTDEHEIQKSTICGGRSFWGSILIRSGKMFPELMSQCPLL